MRLRWLAFNEQGKARSYLEKNPFAKLSDVVTQILYDEIVVLDIPPSSKLNINQIATDLGISRTPVVEAINRLQAIGFVETRPRTSGFYVTDMNMRDMIDLYDARTAIECEAAALCAENASAEAIAQMDGLATEFKKAVPKLDGIRLKETDMPFHKLIVDSCGNKYLIRSYNELLPNLKMYQGSWTKFINPGTTNPWSSQVVHQHVAIVSSIKLHIRPSRGSAWRIIYSPASILWPTATTRATPSPSSSAAGTKINEVSQEESPVKIAMIGSGAAGSVFAAYLRRGGADMYLVDKYKAHMDKIAADGLTFRCKGEECVLTGFHTSPTAAELPVMDIVILMVKATQTDGVMPDVMHCVGPQTVVVSLQNGIGNDEILMKYVPRTRIMYGAGVIGTELAGPGCCVSKPEDGIQMFFGAAENSPETDAAGKYLEECFEAGGCHASFEDDVRVLLWKKAVTNSGYNAVCAVTRMRLHFVMDNEWGMKLLMNIWKEGCAVAKALGVGDIWPLIEGDIANLRANLGDYYPSMAQDAVLHHRQTEVEVLNGAIAMYGERLGVPTRTTACSPT